MIGTLNALVAATFLFVGGHFLLSSAALRARLVARLGDGLFRALYAAVMLASFLWMIFAYGAAPVEVLWVAPAAVYWVPLLVMPIAAILIVASLTSPNPTMAGGERLLVDATGSPAAGITSITRHPFLWGTGLWALAHLTVNGDVASVVLMGGVAVLSFAGMAHIDRRKEAALGAAWGPMKLTTSRLPFAAILSGRCKLDWRGIGWWRPLLGLVLYLVLLMFHVSLFGVSPLPL
ncbi:NnrU family protein [Pelagibius litoralis]|uniref:NnrU family protein n=1 Tax=Pelagibius litoralis TaxID=374515 RepID=A0A967EWS6_9PROT|nr:NnrU family protein [Pelagibius litoralis]NIA68133.1 NnrU family protein [Pelagibius litoralis]